MHFYPILNPMPPLFVNLYCKLLRASYFAGFFQRLALSAFILTCCLDVILMHGINNVWL